MIAEKIPYIDQTGWIALSPWVKYKKFGDFVAVYVSTISYSTAAAWVDLSEVLPADARPSDWLRFVSNRSDGKSCLFDIYADGTMKAFSDTAGFTTQHLQVIFML